MRTGNAFTLIELLVVIAIIAVLAGLRAHRRADLVVVVLGEIDDTARHALGALAGRPCGPSPGLHTRCRGG